MQRNKGVEGYLGVPSAGMFWTEDQKPDEAVIMKLAFIDQHERLAAMVPAQKCKTLDELTAIQNQDQRERDPGNCAFLNGAREPYFDGGLLQMRKAGKFPFYSSRNHNFSNRNQHGCICVGQTKCTVSKGCQVVIEEELREKQSRESGNNAKMVEMSKPACDRKCKSAKWEKVQQEIASAEVQHELRMDSLAKKLALLAE